ILSCIVYGMAFDFFNISGSLFVETNTDNKIRSSAQGLFMMMTNGEGAVLGSSISGWMIDRYFTLTFTDSEALATSLDTSIDNSTFLQFSTSRGIPQLEAGRLSQVVRLKDWRHSWLTFALYTLIVAVLLALFFRHKHKPSVLMEKL